MRLACLGVIRAFWLVMHFYKQGQQRHLDLGEMLLFSVLSEFEGNYEARKEKPPVCFALCLLTYAQLSFADFG